jgi:hypothetical protein
MTIAAILAEGLEIHLQTIELLGIVLRRFDVGRELTNQHRRRGVIPSEWCDGAGPMTRRPTPRNPSYAVQIPSGELLSLTTLIVRFWHKADIPTRSINVRFWG